jgi:hypothetical protein
MPTLKAAVRMEVFCFWLWCKTRVQELSRIRNSLSVISVSPQKKLYKSCTHSK